jgi:hypothetical protein
MGKQLIELVRERPELYDIQSARYSENTALKQAWEKYKQRRKICILYVRHVDQHILKLYLDTQNKPSL